MEVKAAEGSGGEARDERRRHEREAGEGQPAQGAADGAGRLGGREAAARPFRSGDEGRDGRIRHLEARAEQRFGLARQDDERRQRQVAHAQRRPVDQNRAEHDEGHDQRPLGRHLDPEKTQ